VSNLVEAAFEALGSGPTGRELVLVAAALRESGDELVAALFDEQAYGPGFDRLGEIAERARAGGFVALDLYVEIVNPGALAEARGIDARGGVRG
jgi:hypothetical protein